MALAKFTLIQIKTNYFEKNAIYFDFRALGFIECPAKDRFRGGNGRIRRATSRC